MLDLNASLTLALDTLRAHPNWYLFPVVRLEKDPAIKANLENASNNPNQIRAWHRQFPGCNWGVALKKSGLLVVDVDVKDGKDGWITLDALMLQHGQLPETFTVQSPSGGMHFYFEGTGEHKQKTSAFGPDVDSPGYVLISGCWLSKYASQRGYETVKDVPLAKAPAWLYAILHKGKAKPEGDKEAPPEVDLDKKENIDWAVKHLQEEAPPSIANQNGNITSYNIACLLRDKGISESTTLQLMQAWYNIPGKCEPLWLVGTGPDAERLDVIIRNAFKYGQNAQGVGTAEYAFSNPDDAVDVNAPEFQAFVENWNKRLTQQNKERDRKSKDKVKERLVDSMFDPITGEPVEDQTVIDPTTGEPFNVSMFDPITGAPTDDDDPPPGGASSDKAKEAETDKADAERAEQQGAAADVPKTEQTLKWVRANWAWVVGLERWIRLPDGVMWNTKQFDSYYANHDTRASISNTLFKLDNIRKAERIVYRPGKKILLDSGRSINLWRPSKIKPAQGDTTIWHEHLNYLFQNEDDKNLVLDWMAWVYRFQDKKPNHGLMIVGRNTGTGKSILARVMEQLIGPANTQRPKNSSLKGDFNAWALQCKLCIMEELMQVGRQEVANELRDTITESTIEVNIKNITAQKIENYMAMMALTNHRNAMPMMDTERRWLVIETFAKRPELGEAGKGDGEYFERVWKGVLENPQALAAIAFELQNRDLGKYNALLSPKETAARAQMIALSRTDVESWLFENIGNYPLTRNLVTVQDVIECMPPNLQKVLRVQTNVRGFLQDRLRGEQLRAVRFPDGSRRRLWCLHGRAQMISPQSDDKIVSLYENERRAAGQVADEQAVTDFMES